MGSHYDHFVKPRVLPCSKEFAAALLLVSRLAAAFGPSQQHRKRIPVAACELTVLRLPLDSLRRLSKLRIESSRVFPLAASILDRS